MIGFTLVDGIIGLVTTVLGLFIYDKIKKIPRIRSPDPRDRDSKRIYIEHQLLENRLTKNSNGKFGWLIHHFTNRLVESHQLANVVQLSEKQMNDLEIVIDLKSRLTWYRKLSKLYDLIYKVRHLNTILSANDTHGKNVFLLKENFFIEYKEDDKDLMKLVKLFNNFSKFYIKFCNDIEQRNIGYLDKCFRDRHK